MPTAGDYLFCASALISLAESRNDATSEFVKAVGNDILKQLRNRGTEMPVMLLAFDPDDVRAVNEAIAERATMPVPDYESSENGCLIAEICRGWMEMIDVRKGETPRWIKRAEGEDEVGDE